MEKMFDLDVQVQAHVQTNTPQEKAYSWTPSCFCSIGTDSSCWLDPM